MEDAQIAFYLQNKDVQIVVHQGKAIVGGEVCEHSHKEQMRNILNSLKELKGFEVRLEVVECGQANPLFLNPFE